MSPVPEHWPLEVGWIHRSRRNLAAQTQVRTQVHTQVFVTCKLSRASCIVGLNGRFYSKKMSYIDNLVVSISVLSRRHWLSGLLDHFFMGVRALAGGPSFGWRPVLVERHKMACAWTILLSSVVSKRWPLGWTAMICHYRTESIFINSDFSLFGPSRSILVLKLAFVKNFERQDERLSTFITTLFSPNTTPWQSNSPRQRPRS